DGPVVGGLGCFGSGVALSGHYDYTLSTRSRPGGQEESCPTPTPIPTPTTGPCATSPTTGASPTTPSAPTEPADEANSPNPTPCSAAHPPGVRQPSSTSNDPARAPAPICERTPPVSDWEQQSPKGAPMSDPRSEEHTSELQSRETLVCRP